jgi:phosphatidate cytidylyltransferase
VFIPVYVFLAIPVVSALANDPQRFLERNAKLQWGIMVCIYGLSHVPALMLLNFHKYHKNAFLMLFLVLVVQSCMVTQHLVHRWLHRHPVAPAISHSFTWRSWWVGMAVGSLLGALLAGITPFVPGPGVCAGLYCLCGRVAGAFCDEGAQTRPRHPDLARRRQGRHRGWRHAGPH